MNDGMLVSNEHRCPHRGLARYPSIDHQLWDPSSSWILKWDNIVKHPGARARGCHCDVHKPPWLYPNLGKNAKNKNRNTHVLGYLIFYYFIYSCENVFINIYSFSVGRDVDEADRAVSLFDKIQVDA